MAKVASEGVGQDADLAQRGTFGHDQGWPEPYIEILDRVLYCKIPV